MINSSSNPMHKRFGILYLLLLLLVAMTTACDSNRIFDQNQTLKEGVWKSNERLLFEVDIRDLTARYNLYLQVRNSADYPFSNLYIFITTTYPDGRLSRDTAELTLADYDGRWLGKGMGSLKFNDFLFQKGIRFKQQGTYRLEFEQAMRVNELKGIQDFGLRIEKE